MPSRTLFTNRYQHIEAEKNSCDFADNIFKCIFLNENVSISLKDFTEFLFLRSNLQCPSIGSDNGLAPARRQAIIWINDG